ncbi:MAG: hypothetical protein WCP20_15735 [Desulfuromonadales bacterium]
MPEAQKPDVQKLNDWNLTANIALTVHYCCGVLGVASSCYAATDYPLSKLSAVMSAICFGILGFAQPSRMYHKFMSAARILQHAVYQYERQMIDESELFKRRYKAEMFIQAMDEKDFKNSKTYLGGK